MSFKDELKSIIIRSGWTMSSVVDEINKRHNTNYSLQNFSSKLIRGTLRYNEVSEVLDIIGYEIKWEEKVKQH